MPYIFQYKLYDVLMWLDRDTPQKIYKKASLQGILIPPF
jgi:hypothetical protein